MADDDKNIQNPEETAPVEEESQDQPAVKDETPQHHPQNSVAEKRGRMVATGVIAAAILSVIAVVVSGIFQLTAKWMIVCPTDLPINDPAKVLWQEVVSEKDQSKTLGVSGALVQETRFKGPSPEAK
ncbi:MAG: hypothetical protein HY912_05410 [Desulfomonile tiedjei]|uniref:Uncharacterized protein n=1 Tax=Desulfomonile tiedjei TaxID=2358 RepID=A0A9D6V1C4_9BACT|nr:hypothetical protein [Desulfomonile tiedjei]